MVTLFSWIYEILLFLHNRNYPYEVPTTLISDDCRACIRKWAKVVNSQLYPSEWISCACANAVQRVVAGTTELNKACSN